MRKLRKLRKSAKNKSRGYALLETLFYIAFFGALSAAVISTLVTMGGAFRLTSLYTEIARSGSIMERITREIRTAEDWSVIGGGNLRLNTRDQAGNPKTVEFVLAGSSVQLLENSVFTGNLNPPGIAVDSLVFTPITTLLGKAVKIEMIVRSLRDADGSTFDFFDTVVLRGSY